MSEARNITRRRFIHNVAKGSALALGTSAPCRALHRTRTRNRSTEVRFLHFVFTSQRSSLAVRQRFTTSPPSPTSMACSPAPTSRAGAGTAPGVSCISNAI